MAEELRQAVTNTGLAASSDAHYGGILHRGWVDLETRLRGKNDAEIIRECLNGDEATLKHYDHALRQELDENLQSLVEKQRREVQMQIDEVTSWLRSRAQFA
jgi:uncharacterized protein (TIGR02284 family)